LRTLWISVTSTDGASTTVTTGRMLGWSVKVYRRGYSYGPPVFGAFLHDTFRLFNILGSDRYKYLRAIKL
jgi:hypothetical protein